MSSHGHGPGYGNISGSSGSSGNTAKAPVNGGKALFTMMMAFGIAFALCGAASAVVFMDHASLVDPIDGDAELMLMDASTGKLTDLGKKVPNQDIHTFQLNMADNLATWFSEDQFKTYDLENREMKDKHTTRSFNPAFDTFCINGPTMMYSSSQNSNLVIRETDADTARADNGEVIESKDVPTKGEVVLTASDGEDFYWVEHDHDINKNIIYRYDNDADMRTPVHMDDDTIEDLAAGHDHLAIMTNDTGIPKVKLVNTRTMEERNHCTGCDMPRIGGTTLAVRDANGIYVEDLETGDDLRIEEENEILDIRTDGDNVAWSWIPPYNVDPITILNLKTGEMVTHQPDHLIFTFNMAEGQVLFLRSVVPLPSDEIDPAMGTICLAPVFLLCSIMSGVGLFAYNYKQKNIQKRIYQQQYQAYWNNYYNSYYYGFQRNNGVYEGHYRY